MIKCRDENGNLIPNILRSERSNALVIRKTHEYDQYILSVKQADRITQLEKELELIKQMILNK